VTDKLIEESGLSPLRRARSPLPTAPKKKRATNKKVTRGLVVLASAAILTVYTAGYLRTEPAAQQVAAQEAQAKVMVQPVASVTVVPSALVTVAGTGPVPASTTISVTPDLVATPSAANTPVAVAQAAIPTARPPTPTTVPPTPTAVPAARYRDGQYAATGYSRHGPVEAQVVVKGGQIISAAITGCQTRYPCSVIAGLPGQVVAAQSANVDLISGASDSSSAYLEAVGTALSKAG